ncbi:MAG: phosphonate ABC transporter, permease protein PhnE [Euryarchaeota archaeon]|nr:phosphonate ABC transporter, permease protein PhnE [Euryarchaeota archaeon]
MNRGMLNIGLLTLAMLLLTAVMLNDLAAGQWSRFEGGWDNLRRLVTESLWPPDWTVLKARNYPPCEAAFGFLCSKAYLGMVETLKMAFVGTVIGFLGAIVLAPMAASNLSPAWMGGPARLLLAGTRSLPSIIWAILFVAIVGLGPLAGVLAMAFYTVGYLGKLQFESFEGLANGPLEAARAMGMNRTQTFLFVVVPESANGLISQVLFMFEYNVRHGSVLGLVGAGGIGYYLQYYLGFLLYDAVMSLIIVIFIVVVCIEAVSRRLRSFLSESDDVPKASWMSILLSPDQAIAAHATSSDHED